LALGEYDTNERKNRIGFVKGFDKEVKRHLTRRTNEENFMKQIYLSIISLILLNFSFAFSQDILAKAREGQIVILRKNGNWLFYKPSDNTGQKENQSTTATTFNGQIVILNKDGTWIATNNYQSPTIQNPKTQNPNVAIMAKKGHWEEECWETHQVMLEKPTPALELYDWMNGEIPQRAWAGKIVVVDFWATWCGPCRKAIPHNNELFQRYKNQGVLIIGACGSGNRGGQDRMVDVVTQLGLEYPTAKVSDSYVEQWNVRYWPTYAIVDRNGNLRAIGVSPSYVEPIIKALLRESP
jgi:thiol-disulfide isomerase/thioredoxin